MIKSKIRFNNVILTATLYANPIEVLVANLWPLQAGLFILKSRMHIVTFYSWGFYRLLFTTEEHSGFDFPWHLNKIIPYSIDAKHHSFHHEKNMGNYGQYIIFWDWLFGTDVEFRKFEAQEKLRKSVKGN